MVGNKGQMQAIKKHLESGKTLTSMEAFQLYGCTRLSAKIFDLRESGMNIDTIMIEGTNRYDMPVRYALYRLSRTC